MSSRCLAFGRGEAHTQPLFPREQRLWHCFSKSSPIPSSVLPNRAPWAAAATAERRHETKAPPATGMAVSWWLKPSCNSKQNLFSSSRGFGSEHRYHSNLLNKKHKYCDSVCLCFIATLSHTIVSVNLNFTFPQETYQTA